MEGGGGLGFAIIATKGEGGSWGLQCRTFDKAGFALLIRIFDKAPRQQSLFDRPLHSGASLYC